MDRNSINEARRQALKITKVPKIVIPSSNLQKEQEKKIKETGKLLAQHRQKMDDEQFKQTELLTRIADNTASLSEIAATLHASNLKQDEMAKLMGELFAISSAKSEKEAESKYKKVIRKISNLGSDVGNVSELVGLATQLFNVITALIK